MIDAKTAKKNSDDLNNSTNQNNLAIIESKIVEASNQGKYSVSIGEKYINQVIVIHLKELGYKIDRMGLYDGRDPQGSVEPYYTIAWVDSP